MAKQRPATPKRQLLRSMKQEIAQLRETISRTQKELAAELSRQTELLDRVQRIRGTKWVDVNAVKLKPGKIYFVRRVFLYRGRDERPPVVAKWEPGWLALHGRLTSDTGTCTIEVWQ